LCWKAFNVDVAFTQCFVRQHVVVEGHQFDVQTVFFFRHFLRDFSNLLLSTDNDADFDMVRIFFFLDRSLPEPEIPDQCADCRNGFKFVTTYPFLIRLAFEIIRCVSVLQLL
jgi:hypothetical protein